MYKQLMVTRWTNMPTLLAFLAVSVWILALALLRILGEMRSASWEVLGFVLLSLLLPAVIIGDSQQYRALGMTRQQSFTSELTLLVPLAVLAIVLFLVGSAPWVWALSFAVFLLGLGWRYWALADIKTEQRVRRAFLFGEGLVPHSGGPKKWATPSVQQIYTPAAKGAILLTLILTGILASGFLTTVTGQGSFSAGFIVLYTSLFVSSGIMPVILEHAGGAGAWHTFGLSRKKYIFHAVAASSLGTFIAGSLAFLAAGAIDMGAVEQAHQKFVLVWAMCIVAGASTVVIRALFDKFANFIYIMLMMFFVAVFTSESAESSYAGLGPITAVIAVIFVAIASFCAFIVITGRDGKRMTLQESSLTKLKA